MDRIDLEKSLQALVVVIVIGVISWGIGTINPDGVDWTTAFRPAVWRLLRGEQLYGVYTENHLFLNAPWTLVPLIPFALLPVAVGRTLLISAGLAAFIYTAHRLGARPIAIGLLILSPPVFHGLLNANVDWLAALGFVMPPTLGLFFISMKPQLGIAVGIFWLVDIWRKEGFRKVVRVFGPFTIVLLISFLIWGFWPEYFNTQLDLWWNASFWPQSLPVGLGLLVAALRKTEVRYAMAASPCLSPYVLFHSWVGGPRHCA